MERVRESFFNAILERLLVSPVRLNPNLPPKLEDIINKALEKDRNLRYQDAADMRADLQLISAGLPDTRAVIDGEICSLDKRGRPQFRNLLFHRGNYPVLHGIRSAHA